MNLFFKNDFKYMMENLRNSFYAEATFLTLRGSNRLFCQLLPHYDIIGNTDFLIKASPNPPHRVTSSSCAPLWVYLIN